MRARVRQRGASMSGARWRAYGEGGIYVDLGLEEARDRAARTHAAAAVLRETLRETPGKHAAEVVVGAGVLVVVGLEAEVGEDDSVARAVAAAVQAAWATPAMPMPMVQAAQAPRESGTRLHTLQVVYDGPDLAEVAAAAGMSEEEVIARHTGAEVVVELLGFLPGFAYCSGVDPRLVLPRRSSPRKAVPAGSVAVAGGFTGIYPRTSPGGWWLLGRAVGVTLFDADREPPTLLAPGDRMRFVRVASAPVTALGARQEGLTGQTDGVTETPAVEAQAGEMQAQDGRAQRPAALGAIILLSAPPGATVQDGGRPGQLARGLPPSGPLDAETHGAANAAVGNARDAAAIEIPLGSMEMQAIGEVVVSVDGAPAVRLADGERLQVPAGPAAVRYLAVRGGVDVAVQLGARATLAAAGLGGLGGRPLRRGDRLPVGGAEEGAGEGNARAQEEAQEGTQESAPARGAEDGGSVRRSDDAGAVLVVTPGPHVDRFPEGALDALCAGVFRVSRLGDRVGVRLEGTRVPRVGPDLALPSPMIRGAMQVTTDGTPIVLGPDHPVTGGYPVLAVLGRTEQARFARMRPGNEVRFALKVSVSMAVLLA
ncbi:Allophanate hydrolase 2 subunit 1 [Chondromyces apiculatus DSM 436]|uniref:Allophanate hydrolase 2 subunit 1 n=2 Tax=Chondromyces apiculatus TaxID=51 RepID=A0A017SVW6_9BACT|nr:Allophanate hydrolase 2 subunit 1 [Chondromyces apiculatus DSM 436]